MFPDNFLIPERIQCHGLANSRKRVLQKIGKLLTWPDQRLDEHLVFDALFERERMGSTGFGKGIAIPHARIEGLTQARGAFIRLEHSIDFNSLDKQPVDLVFALIVPMNANKEHLELIAILARCIKETELLQRLRTTTQPEDVIKHVYACQ